MHEKLSPPDQTAAAANDSAPSAVPSETLTDSSRREMMKLLGAGAAVSMLPFSAVSALEKIGGGGAGAKRPNIILIVLDDVGFSDIGAYGSEIKTPNLDSLAMSGLRYNRFGTCAICSATRAALLTGRNPQTVHMEDLPARGKAPSTPIGVGPCNSGELPTNAQTLAQAMRAAGYSTYALGKWHLCPMYSDAPERNMQSWPLQRGFDYFYGFLSGHTNQYHPDLVENNIPLPTPDSQDYQLTTDLIDHAIRLLQPSKGDNPSFLYLALGAAHTPYHVHESYIAAYKGAYDDGWDILRERRFARQKQLGIIPADTVLPPRNPGDAAWDSLDDMHRRVFSRFMETYAGYLTYADEQIGRLIAFLKQSGQYDDTLIVLFSDNGAASEGGPNGGFYRPYGDKTDVADMYAHLDLVGGPETYMLYQRPWAGLGDTPLRRYKLWPYLGGVRTPLIVHWPSRIKDPGAIRAQFVDVIDIAPTLLEVARTEFATEVDGVGQIPVAGRSVLKTFFSPRARTRTVQFFSLRGNRAITRGDWRAVAMHEIDTDFSQDPWQLFDLSRDFSESQDLSRKYPEKLEEMKRLWWAEAKRYSNPPVVKPRAPLYRMNGIGDAFLNTG